MDFEAMGLPANFPSANHLIRGAKGHGLPKGHFKETLLSLGKTFKLLGLCTGAGPQFIGIFLLSSQKHLSWALCNDVLALNSWRSTNDPTYTYIFYLLPTCVA